MRSGSRSGKNMKTNRKIDARMGHLEGWKCKFRIGLPSKYEVSSGLDFAWISVAKKTLKFV